MRINFPDPMIKKISDIQAGECFCTEHRPFDVYIKTALTQTENHEYINALNIEEGFLCFFEANTPIIAYPNTVIDLQR